jgi:putative RecB family exonuclease
MILDSLFKHKPMPLQPLKTSPGKLRAYRQCPLKYKFTLVDGRKTNAKPSPHLAFDAAINGMLESFQTKLLAGRTDITEPALLSELNRVWRSDKFTDPEEEKLFRADAEKAAENMARWFRDATGTILTYQNKPAIGMFAPWYPRPLTLWTRLDRVETLPDNTIRVIDFKSGARESSAAELRSDMGVRIQAMAAREMFGKSVISIAMVYARSGNTVEIPLDMLDLEFLTADVKSIAQDIQNNRFEPNPGPLCSVCDFMEECRGWRKKLPWKQTGETRDTYRERLRLSYSKMSLYERCPRAYHALYHEKIPPKPQPFFSFGSCIHAVMEDFYDPASREKPTRDRMMDLLEEQWRHFRAGYRSAEEEERYRTEAVRMLEMYHRQFVENKPFKPAAQIERYFELPVGTDAIMTGFIDRIDTLPKGGSIVLDYKTEPTERTQEAVDTDLQLTLYYWAAREFLGLDIRKLGLYMMSHDTLMLTSRTPDDVPPLLERISDVSQRIQNETAFEPRINKYCLSCDHLVGCPLEQQIRNDETLRSMEFTDDDVNGEAAGDDL